LKSHLPNFQIAIQSKLVAEFIIAAADLMALAAND